MTAYKTLLYEKKGHVAYITLNRPERMNAFNHDSHVELPAVWQAFGQDPDAWVAVITGAGDRAFSTGIDVKDVAGGSLHMPRGLFDEPKLTAKENLGWKPVICALNGLICGGALRFVANADIVIAAPHVEIFDTHVMVGIPAALEQIPMARKMPLGESLKMAVVGRTERMSVQRAYEIGLVQEIVPKERLMARATELADMICENAPLAVQGSVEALWASLDLPLKEALDYGFKIVQANFLTEDFKEGPRAFAEKRKPQWKGR